MAKRKKTKAKKTKKATKVSRKTTSALVVAERTVPMSTTPAPTVPGAPVESALASTTPLRIQGAIIMTSRARIHDPLAPRATAEDWARITADLKSEYEPVRAGGLLLFSVLTGEMNDPPADLLAAMTDLVLSAPNPEEAYKVFARGRDYFNTASFLRMTQALLEGAFESARRDRLGLAVAHAAVDIPEARELLFNAAHDPAYPRTAELIVSALARLVENGGERLRQYAQRVGEACRARAQVVGAEDVLKRLIGVQSE